MGAFLLFKVFYKIIQVGNVAFLRDSCIHEVTPKREGCTKIGHWGDFQGINRVTRGEGRAKDLKFELTSFMDSP